MHFRGSRARWLVVSGVLVVLLLSLAPLAWAGPARETVTAAVARREAARLVSRVSEATRANPRSGSAEPEWDGAFAGDPLLLHSVDGSPTSFLVPVLDDSGKAVSVVGVSAKTGEWSWYSDIRETRFPLVDASEATRKVTAFLRESGVSEVVPPPRARTAPDKNVYWFFELSGTRGVREVYLPAFFQGTPSTNLEPAPWEGVPEDSPPAEAGDPPERRSGTAAGAPPDGAVAGGLPLYPGGAPAAHDIPDVPHHYQETGYWCGPASMQMLFGYWGENVLQSEIASVVNARPSVGCYSNDLLRAGHFSSNSSAYADPYLRGYTPRPLGYGAAEAFWRNGSGLYSRRYSDLKELVSRNYPVLILTYYDSPPSSGHFRVVKGYDDSIGTFIVHDPWYSPPYQGPNVNFNQSYLVDTLWPYSNRWGMISAPWSVVVEKPLSVTRGQVFSITADIGYRGPSPFGGQFPCAAGSAVAVFQSGGDYELLSGPASQAVPGIGATGSSGSVSWTARALTSRSTSDIAVEARGYVSGSSYSYSSYSDWIGGVGIGPGEPPTTTRTWGHDSVGVPAGSTSWYLAEGCTNGGFETWVVVQNPGGDEAHVELTYMTPSGPVSGPRATLPANTRESFFVGDRVPDQWSVSTEVASDVPVIAERSVYGPGRQWGHDSIGAEEKSEEWYLAEGSTGGGLETWILVQNPNDSPAQVSLTYMTPSGPVNGQAATLAANSRKTFFAADVVPDQWSVSTKVTASRPVIAERSMYGPGRQWGHDSIGVTGPSTAWYLAEGCTNGGFETWVVVQNPNDVPAAVELTYMTPDGERPGPTVELAANTRRTFNASDDVPGEWEVSATVTSDLPVIAERAMYGSGRQWGHASIGVPSPGRNWYLAEGCTQNGFETWILVQNPNGSDADIEVTFMTPDGPVPGPSERIPPYSRTTYNAAYYVPATWEVSAKVTSDKPVIAERSMYGDPRR